MLLWCCLLLCALGDNTIIAQRNAEWKGFEQKHSRLDYVSELNVSAKTRECL